jgi:predicted Zn-dependent protease
MNVILRRMGCPRLGVVVVALALAGCATAPETGRRQLILMGGAEEVQLGLQSFEQTKKEIPISRDPAVNALVQKVGRRIAGVAHLPNAQWEFVVFQSPEANAFCLPGGKVGVYTGILPITKDEAGLATVIGHEVAHAEARHGAERMSRAMVRQGVGDAASSYIGKKDARYQQAFGSLYGAGSQLLEALPHSRKQESEADEIGLIYMARAGYDPEAAVTFWQRFAAHNKAAGNTTPWYLRTHPLDEKRIEDLRQWMPRAKAAFKPAS